jgi:hypothetical protein
LWNSETTNRVGILTGTCACTYVLAGKEHRELQKQQAHLKTELASLTAMGLMHSEEGVVYGLGAHVVAAVCPGIDQTVFLDRTRAVLIQESNRQFFSPCQVLEAFPFKF